MKRKELYALLDAVKNLRTNATDETALQSVYAFPVWKPNTDYSVGDRYREDDKLYRCIQSHTSQEGWNPSVTPALWVKISLDEWPEWVQPLGSEDAYRLGGKVSHNGKHWTSDIDYNTFEPGVYGWTEI